MAPASPELTLLAAYNGWANRKLFGLAAKLDARSLLRKDSYDSVVGILRHLVHVESNFLLMSRGEERVKIEDTEVAPLARRCAEIDAGYERFVAAAKAKDLDRAFLVPWFGFEVTVREALLQALTHSQKHRADVCLLLPGLGVEVPGTDLIQWLAESRDPEAGTG
jgi:uncharacterized damage-inducible protein DinB